MTSNLIVQIASCSITKHVPHLRSTKQLEHLKWKTFYYDNARQCIILFVLIIFDLNIKPVVTYTGHHCGDLLCCCSDYLYIIGLKYF